MKKKKTNKTVSNQQFFSVGEVAVLFNFTRQAVYNWIYDGSIPFIQMPNGTYRIAKEDVQAWSKKYKYKDIK